MPGVRWHLERVDVDAAVLPAGRGRAPAPRITGIQFFNFISILTNIYILRFFVLFRASSKHALKPNVLYLRSLM